MRAVTASVPLLVVTLLLAGGGSAAARSIHTRFIVVPRGDVDGPSFYDPWWSPYSAYGVDRYAVTPIGVARHSADLRVEVTPKQAGIYVDGYWLGPAGNVEGALKRLHTTPGGHEITLYLDGYRTVREDIYVRPESTFDLHETLGKLAAGETSAAPPAPRGSSATPGPIVRHPGLHYTHRPARVPGGLLRGDQRCSMPPSTAPAVSN